MIATARGVLRVLGRAGRNFFKDGGLDRSASVAFYTVLALGPIVWLAAATLSRWLRMIDAPIPDSQPGAVFLPEEATGWLERLEQSFQVGPSWSWTLPVLVWVVASAVSALERAVNVAFGRIPRRPLWRTRLKSLGVLGLGWCVLGVSIVSAGLLPRAEELATRFGIEPAAGRVAELATGAATAILGYAVFLLFLKTMPRGRVAWRAVAWGALGCSVLWEIARRLFGEFLAHSTSFGLLRGSLAAVVASLLWIHLSAAIILYGAEIAALINGSREAADP